MQRIESDQSWLGRRLIDDGLNQVACVLPDPGVDAGNGGGIIKPRNRDLGAAGGKRRDHVRVWRRCGIEDHGVRRRKRATGIRLCELHAGPQRGKRARAVARRLVLERERLEHGCAHLAVGAEIQERQDRSNACRRDDQIVLDVRLLAHQGDELQAKAGLDLIEVGGLKRPRCRLSRRNARHCLGASIIDPSRYTPRQAADGHRKHGNDASRGAGPLKARWSIAFSFHAVRFKE